MVIRPESPTEDRAAHVEREAVARVLAGLAQTVEREWHRLYDEGGYVAAAEPVRDAFVEIQTAIRVARDGLAALPQTGDAAAVDWAVSLVLARYCYGDEAWRPLDPEERNAIAEPYLPRARELAPMLLAALTAGADQ